MNETNVQIHCSVCVNPAPSKYNWTYSDGSALRPNMSGTDSDTLTFPMVHEEDFTNYTCIVENVIQGKTHTKEVFDITLFEQGK